MQESTPDIKLTAFAHGAGCGCKIAPAVLADIIAGTAAGSQYPQLLVGNGTNDDAAVYELPGGDCIISTTDFFMPIVDDAFDFGRIAAANAISDVYAMGGRPLMAVAVLGWPVEKLPAALAAEVIKGGRSICEAAGIPLAGGHSIDSPEPFFGLAVTGTVAAAHLKRNSTARDGDLLFLTKPLGTGILSTATKRGAISPEHYQQLLRTLTQLNSVGAALGQLPGVHAMTDVTGFGLLGHLLEMCQAAQLQATIDYQQLSVLPGVQAYMAQNMVPDATYRNWNAYSSQVKMEKGVNMLEAFKLLPDPQTNGGLLLAVAPDAVAPVQACLQAAGMEAFATPIGCLQAQPPHEPVVRVQQTDQT
ncbi:MAG: selenide, water dikinase SelD [Chitinophagaceae bacterium]|nr:selenide, water dikinase SelD [Chitinophagaceae bacterium]